MVAIYMYGMYDRIRLIDRLTAVKKKGSAIRIVTATLLPFCIFAAGYYTANLWWGSHTVVVPHLVGTPSHIAMTTLSQRHLYPHVMGQQEHHYLDPGTIIEQIPRPGQHIKPHQTVFIVTSYTPPQRSTPSFVGMSIHDARSRASDEHVQLREYYLPSIYPSGHVVAQTPQPDDSLNCHHVVVYVAQPISQWRIMPSCIGYDVADVIAFCHAHNLRISIFTRMGSRLPDAVAAGAYAVSHQKPIAGSFIDISDPPIVQVIVTDR